MFLRKLIQLPNPSWPSPQESTGAEILGMRSGMMKFYTAVGPASEVWDRIRPEINEALQDCKEDSEALERMPYSVGVGFCMVGTSPSEAKPTILISSLNERQRKRAKTKIKGLAVMFSEPAIRVRTNGQVPAEPMGSDQELESGIQRNNSYDIIISGQPSNLCGAVLLCGVKARATLGGVIYLYHENVHRPYGITAYHPGTQLFVESQSTGGDVQEIVFDDDSDVASDESDGDGEDTHIDEFVSSTSQGSISSRPDSTSSSETSSSKVIRAKSLDTGLSPNPDVFDSLDRSGTPDVPPNGLDYQIFPIPNSFAQITNRIQIPTLDNSDPQILNPIETVQNAVAGEIWAATCTGVVRGSMSSNSYFLKLAGWPSYQELWEVNLERKIRPGDCGAWIVDSKSRLYGHIVACRPGGSQGFIIPAHKVFKDIEVQSGSKVSLAVSSPSPMRPSYGHHGIFKITQSPGIMQTLLSRTIMSFQNRNRFPGLHHLAASLGAEHSRPSSPERVMSQAFKVDQDGHPVPRTPHDDENSSISLDYNRQKPLVGVQGFPPAYPGRQILRSSSPMEWLNDEELSFDLSLSAHPVFQSLQQPILSRSLQSDQVLSKETVANAISSPLAKHQPVNDISVPLRGDFIQRRSRPVDYFPYTNLPSVRTPYTEGLLMSTQTDSINEPVNIHIAAKSPFIAEEDSDFKLHPQEDFKFGRVFKIHFNEPIRSNEGKVEITEVRPFLIVREFAGHVICLPITTYGGQATTKSGVIPHHHSIVYTELSRKKSESRTKKPTEIQGEVKLSKKAIRIIPMSAESQLDPRSRLNYYKLYSIDIDVPVQFIGTIFEGHKKYLLRDYSLTRPLESVKSDLIYAIDDRNDSNNQQKDEESYSAKSYIERDLRVSKGDSRGGDDDLANGKGRSPGYPSTQTGFRRYSAPIPQGGGQYQQDPSSQGDYPPVPRITRQAQQYSLLQTEHGRSAIPTPGSDGQYQQYPGSQTAYGRDPAPQPRGEAQPCNDIPVSSSWVSGAMESPVSGNIYTSSVGQPSAPNRH